MAQNIRRAVAGLLILILMAGPSPTNRVMGANLDPGPIRIYFPLVSSPTEIFGLGPDGGGVTPVIFDSKNPTIAYAGTWGAGVYKSSDGGSSWHTSSVGLVNLLIQSLALNPLDSNILYAGTYKDGVYKSVNGGVTWTQTGPGLNSEAIVYSLAIDPSQPDILYAGTRSPGSNPPWGGGVFKSSDGGKSWSNFTHNLLEDWVYGLAIDPRNPQSVYAITHSKGVSHSTDGGHSWKAVNNGLYDQSGRSVAIDPSNSQIVYAGMWHGSGIFKTTNGGQSWSVVNNGLNGAKIITITIDPIKPTTLYALSYLNGVFKSNDGGKSWFADGLWPDYVFSLAVDPSQHDHLLASGVNDGLYSSMIGGTAWVGSSHGLHATTVTAAATDPVVPGMIYAGLNGQGVYRSNNNGIAWTAVNGGLSDLNVRSLVTIPGVVLAGTNAGGIFRSTNNGLDWQAANQGLPMAGAKLAMDNPLLSRYLTWGPAEDLALEGMNEAGLDGVLPKAVATAPILALAAAPAAPANLYAGTAGNGVYRSTNSGVSWSSAGLGGKLVSALAVDRSNPAIVYAGSDGAGGTAWKSVDAGKNWAQIQTGITGLSVYGLSGSPTKAGTLYAGTSNGVYQSTNSGSQWIQIGLKGFTVNALITHPQSEQVLFAGTQNGVYFSLDGGATWKAVDPELINPQVWCLAVGGANSEYVYMGTQASGMYRLKFRAP